MRKTKTARGVSVRIGGTEIDPESGTSGQALVTDGAGTVAPATVAGSGVSNPLGADLSAANTYKVTSLADATADGEAVNLKLLRQVGLKLACVVATTSNITLSGEQTLDGVTTSASRVLVNGQTLPQQNGIYVSAAGAWARASDANTVAKLPAGTLVPIAPGATLSGGKVYKMGAQPVTLGTTAIAFAVFGDGLSSPLAADLDFDSHSALRVAGIGLGPTGGDGAARTIAGAASTVLDQPGTGVTVQAGAGADADATHAGALGGAVDLRAGAGGIATAAHVAGAGGAAYLRGGDGGASMLGASGGQGGDAQVIAGAGSHDQYGGRAVVSGGRAGANSGNGGEANVSAGDADNGNGGSASLTGGYSFAGGGGGGAYVNGGGSDTGGGGEVGIYAGDGFTAGGPVSINAGGDNLGNIAAVNIHGGDVGITADTSLMLAAPVTTLGGYLDADGNRLRNLPAPAASTDAARLADVAPAGTTLKPVRLVATTALPPFTYSAGTYTANANGALPNIDSTAPALNDDLALAGEGTLAHQGLVTITSLGSVGTPWTMQRRSDAPHGAAIPWGAAVRVTDGVAGLRAVLFVDGPVGSTGTIGTNSFKFATPDVRTPLVVPLDANSKDITNTGTISVITGKTIDGVAELTLRATGANGIQLWTNSTLRASIFSGGNIRFGSTNSNPSFAFQVDGNAYLANSLTLANNLGLYCNESGGTSRLVVVVDGSDVCHLGNTALATRIGGTSVRLPNNIGAQWEDSGGTGRELLKFDGSNILQFGHASYRTKNLGGRIDAITRPGAYPYTVLTTDRVVSVSGGSAHTLTLPNAPADGTMVRMITHTGGNTQTINRGGSDVLAIPGNAAATTFGWGISSYATISWTYQSTEATWCMGN